MLESYLADSKLHSTWLSEIFWEPGFLYSSLQTFPRLLPVFFPLYSSQCEQSLLFLGKSFLLTEKWTFYIGVRKYGDDVGNYEHRNG